MYSSKPPNMLCAHANNLPPLCATMLATNHISRCINGLNFALPTEHLLHQLYNNTVHNNGWPCGVVVSGVNLINEGNRHRARLVLGWVPVCSRVNHLGM